jgi:hypothetical protein
VTKAKPRHWNIRRQDEACGARDVKPTLLSGVFRADFNSLSMFVEYAAVIAAAELRESGSDNFIGIIVTEDLALFWRRVWEQGESSFTGAAFLLHLCHTCAIGRLGTSGLAISVALY